MTAARPAPGRKARKQQTERLRRELERELREKAARMSCPVRDDGPPPRID